MRQVSVVVLMLVGAVGVRAQGPVYEQASVEINFFAGYQFFGDFESYDFAGGFYLDDLEVEESETYGVMISFPTWAGPLVEISWSHQDSEIQVQEFFAPPTPVVDVSLDYFQVGGQYVFGDERVRPYTAGSFGVTYIDTDGFGDTTRFSLTGGGGVKLFLSERVALRLDGRLKGTFFDSGFDLYCDPFGCAGFIDSWSWLFQAEASAGLTIGF